MPFIEITGIGLRYAAPALIVGLSLGGMLADQGNEAVLPFLEKQA